MGEDAQCIRIRQIFAAFPGQEIVKRITLFTPVLRNAARRVGQ